MQKKIFFGILIVLILGVAIFWFTSQKAVAPKTDAPVSQKSQSEISASEEEIVTDGKKAAVSQPNENNTVALDDEWEMHTNNILGFSMKIPKEALSLLDQKKLVPVSSYQQGNIDYIYVDDEGGYMWQKLDKFNDEALDEYEKVTGVPWAILVGSVKNDAELLDFIQKRYGETCQIGDKKETASGTYDIKVKADPDPEGKCFLNWILAIKYNPEFGKVAAWDLGQSTSFWGPHDVTYDQEMEDSFEFIR